MEIVWYGAEGKLPHLKNEPEMVELPKPLNNQTMTSKGELPTFKHLRTNPIVLSSPLPNTVYHGDKEYPYLAHLNNFAHSFVRDYPNGLFVSKNTKIPVMTHLKSLPLLGIAKNAEKISRIDFPDSLKRISDDSFWGTNLEQVILNTDIKFFKNSFSTSTEVVGGDFEDSDLYNVE